MKEAFILDSSLSVEIRDVPIPKPALGQVLIKIVVSGTNPKDWKMPVLFSKDSPPANHGDDMAGYVEAVGEGVKGFQKGDRVGAFHEMRTEHGSFAEYGVAWDYCTFHLPEGTSFEEAATIPLAAMTSALGLYQRLGLPPPFRPATSSTPLVIYGGGSAVGAFAIKLAKASNIHPIIAIAGKSKSFVEGLLDTSKDDVYVDYRDGHEGVVSKIKEALNGQPLLYAYDAISEKGTTSSLLEVLDPNGAITTILPTKEEDDKRVKRTMVGSVHDPQLPFAAKDIKDRQPGDPEFAAAYFALFSRGLAHGWFSGHPYEVVEDGLGGVSKALKDLRDNKASGVKYVMRIGDTDGVQRE